MCCDKKLNFKSLSFGSCFLLCSQLLFIFFVLLSCTDSNPENKEKKIDETYKIDVEAAFDKTLEIPISEIANSIAYFPLETRPDNMLNEIRQVCLTESFIFISDKNRLLQFALSGEFIKQIGKTGKGPGEYTNVIYFAPNEEADIIMVVGGYKINKYNLTGDFLRNLSKSNGFHFVCYSPTRIAFYRNNNIENPINLTITTQDLNPVYKFRNNNPRPKTKYRFGTPPLYVFNSNLYFKENFNDTVFCVKDSFLVPHIIYNEKNLLIDKDFDVQSNGNISYLIAQFEKVKDKLLTKNIYESKRYVFTSYLKGMNPRKVNYIRVLFDKIRINTQIIKGVGFTNNIDGGTNLWPMGIFQDSIMICYQEAYKLKAHVASEAFKNSTPRYPEKKKELEKLANSLTENDNPVLMLVKLKE